MRVLIIEDDSTAQFLLRNILCKFALVTECTNGGTGLQAFCSALKDGAGFDLVCLDIGLPDVQGYELLRLFRLAEAENSAKPSAIIVLSACHELPMIQKMLSLGADGYLAKPVNRVNLIVRLRELGLAVRPNGARQHDETYSQA